MDRIEELKEKSIREHGITADEALDLATVENKQALYAAAAEITKKCASRIFDTCSIINAKSGLCPENCKWCAQSRHHHTEAEVYDLLDEKTCIEQARRNKSHGIGRFSIVTSGRKPNKKQLEQIAKTVESIVSDCGIYVCASVGLLTKDELLMLRQAGVKRIHCNLETAPSYFAQLCTTHTQAQKLKTLNEAKEVGLEICSGGIIGMGESLAQRVELAFALKDLDVQSIPINLLVPIKGTPLENQPLLTDDDILTTIALFRFIHPTAYLRFAGGRQNLSDEMTLKSFAMGINSAIMGDMLTTSGAKIDNDFKLIKEAGYAI